MTDELVEIAARALDDVFGEPVSYERTRAILAAVTPAIEARVTGEIVAWLRRDDFIATADALARGDHKESQP